MAVSQQQIELIRRRAQARARAQSSARPTREELIRQATENPDIPIMDEQGNIIEPMMAPAAPKPSPSIGEELIGAGETALTMATGATGGLAGTWAGFLSQLAKEIRSGEYGTTAAADRIEQEAMRMAGELTYAPRTEAGRRNIETVAEVAEPLAPMVGLTGELATLARAAQASSPLLIETAKMAPSAAREVPGAARRAMGGTKVARMGQRASGGAAAVPQEVVRAEKAAALPTPIELTKGAVTREPAQLSFEKEMMKSPQFGAPLRIRAEENNLQALQNFDKLIDMTEAQAPDIAATGNAVTKALAEGYKAAKNKTRVAYKAARKSDEAQAPVNTAARVTVGPEDDQIVGTVWDYINNKPRGVESSKVTDSARATAIKLGVAAEDADGNLVPVQTTLGKMEDFRREISGMASFGDRTGLRDETILKNIIDKQTEQAGGQLFRAARAERRKQAVKYENRAIVARLVNNVKNMDDPKVAADQVFNKSVMNSSPDEIRFLRRVLATSGEDGKQAWRELQGATMRHIRDEATKGMGMDSQDMPIVSPAKLNGVVTQLDKNGRLDLMLGKKNAEVVRDLNDVVRYVNTVPPGTLINNSGTAGIILAAIAEAGTYGGTMGVPVPVLTGLRFLQNQIKDVKIKRKIEAALKGLQAEE